MTDYHHTHVCLKRKPLDLMKMVPGHRLKQTWRSPIQKAIDGPDPEFEWLHQIADEAAPAVRQRFLAAIQAIRGTVKEAELRAALEAKDIDTVMRVLGLDQPDIPRISHALASSLEPVAQAAGDAALDATHLLAHLTMRFDVVNPKTVQAVRQYGFDLIRQVSDDTREGIRAIVSHAMEFGGHPYEQARQIRGLIGLTDFQANAVANFRRMLTTGDDTALSRDLRDKRFDATLRQTLGEMPARRLSPEEIDRMVQRYADRYLNFRAETIARTETINAANLGTEAAWQQAADKGLLDSKTLRMGWLVTPDDRLCEYCAAVPEMNPDGVPLGGLFETPLGPVRGPALHPNCRCVKYLVSI